MEPKRNCRSTIDMLEKSTTDNPRLRELSVMSIQKTGTFEILTRQTMAWCRYWVQTFSIRMTLNNIGLLTVFLAIVLPRSFIYRLVYPIFRLVFGTLYPAYASYKAVRTKNVKEYVKWMMYWIVFALFTCAETFTDVFFSFWFPFYYEIKIILVLWLLSPATKGSSILYRRFVHPALIRREAEIDEALARATEQGYTAVLHLGTKGVNYATTVLMQTAIKYFSTMTPITTNILLDRQSDLAISSLASPSMATRLTDTDNPDHSSNNDRETDIWPIEPKVETLIVLTDHELSMDEYMLEEYSTDTDLDEEVPDEQQQVPGEQQQQEQQQQLPQMQQLPQQQQEEQSDFKMPEESPPKANKKVPLRRQKSRACKSTSRKYIDDFSDDAEF